MIPLDKSLRSKLENTIKEARDLAEAGALVALQQLGVGLKEADAHLSEAEKELRRRLRAHGRQLGDLRKPDGTQDLARLTEEVAYEHWHRMLFARFLAENNLLMYPDPDAPVAVSLEECEEMAADEGARNGWELAARYASKMLPQIFRPDSPSFELELPPEYQRKLENLLAGLSAEVFQASDSLGWVYQFWQAKRKDEVNASEVKIGARELPAVTQLFTEPYMVSFLLDNSLGAWWAARRLSENDLKTAQTEEELRQKAGLLSVPLEYLRFVRDEESGAWTPAAGTFDGWPEQLGELKTLDPCCGSGHFLVAAFLMLVPMRMEREGLSARECVDAVLRDNLHGLEIDPRCVEIAAFALALTAWRFPEAGGYRPLPTLQVACSGLSISVAKEEWKQLVNGDQNLRIAMDWLYDTFADAPVLGSLLNPARSNAAKIVEWEKLSAKFTRLASSAAAADNERTELGVVAQGLTKAAELLNGRYGWVVTNVPYLARGKQNETLRKHCERYHPEAKNDLATAFLDHCLALCQPGGASSVVLPQNWLFLTSYRKFREKLLREETWNLVARMGEGGFESSAAAGAFTILLTISRGQSTNHTKSTNPGDSLFVPFVPFVDHPLRGLDVSAPRTAAEKATQLRTAEIKSVEQAKQLENPDARVALEENPEGDLLEKYAYSHEGLTTGDLDRFVFKFWEFAESEIWKPYIQNTTETTFYSGRTDSIRWGKSGEIVASFPGSFIKGKNAWDKIGLRITQMRSLPITLYSGEIFGKNAATVVPHNPAHLPAIWCFCSSPEYNEAVRQIDQALKVTNATLVKVPFDLEHWTKVAEEKYPNGLPKPYSDDPTQWIFHGHPVGSDDPLQVAVARLLGYQWPAEQKPRMDANGRECGEMELSDEAWEKVELSRELNQFADKDGIVCIPAVRGEPAAADRLLDLLTHAYSQIRVHSRPFAVQELLAQADHAGKPLETWLRDKFFAQHCKRFQHRPFIWHIWDGLRDGFAALVNYHKFDAKALETLIYTYLGDWIARQKEDIRNGVDGAQEKLAAAENLKKRLELIQQGEPPYDIFVRWKPLEEQPIGWNPDLNDGVRLNIRPWVTAEVLRENKKPKLNIAWEKDRGKDVASAPWYHLFGGDRINDHHLTRAEKEAARKEKAL